MTIIIREYLVYQLGVNQIFMGLFTPLPQSEGGEDIKNWLFHMPQQRKYCDYLV